MKLSILVIFTFLISCDSSSSDKETEDYTATSFGIGTIHIFPPAKEFSIETGRYGDGPLFSEIFLTFPQQFGVVDSTTTFFQSIPTKELTIDPDDDPNHTFWLQNQPVLKNNAKTGFNYVFVDEDGNGIIETAYLLHLDAAAPQDSSKTYIVAKAVKNDGSAITFVKAKELLEN